MLINVHLGHARLDSFEDSAPPCLAKRLATGQGNRAGFNLNHSRKPQCRGLYFAFIVLSLIHEQTTYTIKNQKTQGPLPIPATPILAGMNFLVSPSRAPGRSDNIGDPCCTKTRSPGPSPSSSKSMQALLFKDLCYDSRWS